MKYVARVFYALLGLFWLVVIFTSLGARAYGLTLIALVMLLMLVMYVWVTRRSRR